MQELLEKPHKRRIFLTIAVLIIALLVLLRYFVAPFFCETETQLCSATNDVLDNLVSSSIAALGIAILIFVLTPRDVRRAGLKVVEPREIGPLVADARAGSNRYWFSGNSGRYTRGVTLPELAEAARAENTTKEITILKRHSKHSLR
jgi:hypothetical protein